MSELAVRDIALELDRREGNGLVVELLYRKVGNQVLLHINDTQTGEDLQFPVPPEKASEAFQHPFVYAEPYRSEAA